MTLAESPSFKLVGTASRARSRSKLLRSARPQFAQNEALRFARHDNRTANARVLCEPRLCANIHGPFVI
jgi:hypothetical protein